MPDDPRRITEPASSHGISSTPQIGRLNAQSAELPPGNPVIIMIQPDTITYAHPITGEPLTRETTEFAVRENGGQPMGLPPNFSSAPAPGWRATLHLASDLLQIWFPGGRVFYDGTMPTTTSWRTAAKASTNGIVMITGPFATAADIEPAIRQGRATSTRIPIVIT
ncbi:hypothetical protein [Nocardia brasiliensis]|uniref:hypothetical protein n=1 Tax=Nocardia brasiliensis TaxID=37326 RepID=UPI002458E31F|nr:hypothetical protein [Nocardia brasiliensis]